MGLIDAATAPLRYVINGVVEHGTEATEPLRDLEQIQAHVLHAVEAIKDATEQIEAHVAVIDTLVSSLVPLTASVTRLTDEMASLPALTESVASLTAKLDVVADVLAPLAHAEQDVARVGHLFGRRRQAPPPSPAPELAPAPPAPNA
jgi:hypothetical protein